MTARPEPDEVSDEATLRRWYWLRAELAQMAKHRGVSTSGGKTQLTDRLADHFAGRAHAPAASSPARQDRLPPMLTAATRIEPGQRCTQRLREWCTAQVGSGFAFTGPVRAAVDRGDTTLGEVVELWRATRHARTTQIGPQFELNRFARAWHADNPDGAHAAMLSAWHIHRNTPRSPT